MVQQSNLYEASVGRTYEQSFSHVRRHSVLIGDADALPHIYV